MFDKLGLSFDAHPLQTPHYEKCECCREKEVKQILKSLEVEIRFRLARGQQFMGMGPMHAPPIK